MILKIFNNPIHINNPTTTTTTTTTQLNSIQFNSIQVKSILFYLLNTIYTLLQIMSFQNFDQIINLKVKIITLLDQIIIGQIYTYSSSNEIIIIKTKTNINDNKQNSVLLQLIEL